MKKVVLVASLALAMVATAQASTRKQGAQGAARARASENSSPIRNTMGASNHRMAGCGLGSIAIEDSSKWSQVGAAFLNGTGVQTFGITFGTSNCTEDGLAQASREKDAFVEANYADLRRDLTVGSGDYLSSLASLYGCRGEQGVQFNRALRKHSDAVINSSAATASSVIDSALAQEQLSCQG